MKQASSTELRLRALLSNADREMYLNDVFQHLCSKSNSKLCLLKNGIFAKNNSFGFGKSADIWKSSFVNVL